MRPTWSFTSFLYRLFNALIFKSKVWQHHSIRSIPDLLQDFYWTFILPDEALVLPTSESNPFMSQLDQNLIPYSKSEGAPLLVRPFLHVFGGFLQVSSCNLNGLFPLLCKVVSLGVLPCVRMINNVGQQGLPSAYNLKGTLPCWWACLAIEAELGHI